VFVRDRLSGKWWRLDKEDRLNILEGNKLVQIKDVLSNLTWRELRTPYEITKLKLDSTSAVKGLLNYLGGYDFVNNENDPMDEYGHGTYISGIISGLAKQSGIISARVFDSKGIGYESDILAGIDYCIQNKDNYNISVMLMSFGGGVYNTSCYCDSNIIANASNYAVSKGIFAVAASGNDGEPYLKAPACGTNVTSVGAVDYSDNMANFTNIEPLLDLLAPGVDIESTEIGGGTETRSGTSVSAAVVAGVSALLIENETLNPIDLQYRLRSTGKNITYNGTDYTRIDAYSALLNNITNNPYIQQGNQCEGNWDDYGPLAPECCEEFCEGIIPMAECISLDLCEKSWCGAECTAMTEDTDCTTDGCYGSIRNYLIYDYFCDNLCSVCACDYTTSNPDSSEADCESCQGTDCVDISTTCWLSSTCCGDDTGEFYDFCRKSGAIAWGSCTEAATANCCTGSKQCVEPDTSCRAQGNTIYITSGNDKYSICDPTNSGDWTWDDCDDYTSYCSASACPSGEIRCGGSGFGECSGTSDMDCCGDDGSEFEIAELSSGSDTPSGYNSGTKYSYSNIRQN